MSLHNNVKSGEIEGSATAKQLPDVECSVVTLKADAANSGLIYVGGAGVTAQDGTQDATTGLPLAASEQVTLFVKNLDEIYIICASADDDLFYIVTG